jgi:MFS family permease
VSEPFLPDLSGPARAWGARTFASLRHRGYRLYFTGQVVSLVGMWMQSAAQSWLVYDMTGSKAMLGVVGMVGTVPIVAFSTWGGILADRLSRRRILVATQFAASALALVLGLLATADAAGILDLEVWHILVLAGLLGVVNGFEMPARQAFVVEMVGRADMTNAIALNSAAFHGARIVGPAVAGLVVGAVGPGPCFLLNAASFWATVAALVAIRLDVIEPRNGPSRARATEGFRVAARNTEVAILLAQTFMIGMFGWSYVVLLPAFARDVHGADATGYGVMMSASGVGSMIGSLFVAWGRDARRGRQVLNASIALFAPAVFGFATTGSYALSLVLIGLTGMGLSAFFASANTLIQGAVPDEVRGRVMGVYTLVFGAMMPLGAVVAGGLAEAIGAPATVRIGAAVCAATGIAGWLLRRRLRSDG